MRRIGAPFALALALGVTVNARADTGYQVQNLVSDGFLTAKNPTPDSNLVNAWGLAFAATSPAWVADNGMGLSPLYDGNGNILSLVVTIPSPFPPPAVGTPTGIVANVSTAATSFPVAGAASRFIFSTEDGTILGWSGGTQAIIAVNKSAPPPPPSMDKAAIYKGIALSAGGTGQLLYATDFANGRVDVFNSAFGPATLPAGAFTDPNLPPGYAPFGIQAISGNIYVTYAKQVPGSNDEAHGKGLGVVDVYDPNGVLLDRVATHGKLNAPWGITMAPAGFGKFSNTLLVGNFGDGSINAYDPRTHDLLGQLRGQDGKTIKIDGLWALEFGNGFNSQPVNTLFFTAGPDDENHGVYGRIDPPAPSAHGGGGGDDQGDDNNDQGGGD
jgi:uncharacterized protein (TIGR03118 family)